MPDFKNNRFGGPRKSFGSRPPFKGGGRDFGGPKEMFDAECANCHKMTQVPFKPNGMKPVFCRDCFQPEERPSRDNFRGSDRPSYPKKEFGPRRDSAAPTAARPDTRIDDLKRQVEAINGKLDQLISSFEATNRASALTDAVHSVASKAKPAKKAVAKKGKKSK